MSGNSGLGFSIYRDLAQDATLFTAAIGTQGRDMIGIWFPENVAHVTQESRGWDGLFFVRLHWKLRLSSGSVLLRVLAVFEMLLLGSCKPTQMP